MKFLALSAAFSLLSTNMAFAVKFPESNGYNPPPESSEEMAYDFTGIIALSNCSGSLVRFDDSKNTDKAMVLTNGHCVKMISPGEVMVNQPSSKSFTVLNSSASPLGSISAQKLLYATMTKTDVGLYLTKESYQDILNKYQTPALTLDREHPKTNTAIQVISGYWKKGFSCSIEAEIFKLLEGDWTFEKSLRYARPGCETYGGTSGSPVLNASTRKVIAINNTGNDSGGRCTEDNPCEQDENGNITYEQGLSYAQQTYWIYTCRNAQGAVDLSVPGCMLPKP